MAHKRKAQQAFATPDGIRALLALQDIALLTKKRATQCFCGRTPREAVEVGIYSVRIYQASR